MRGCVRGCVRVHVDSLLTRPSTVSGKLTLQGSVAQRLEQLDKRETELLEDIEKQRGIVKRMKDDRAHYRKKCEDKEYVSHSRAEYMMLSEDKEYIS